MRLPAEWEPQGFVQLTWPHEETAWYELPKVLDCYVQIARAITRYEPLLIVCRDSAECKADMAARGFSPEGLPIRFVECPLNDTWARDHGAISVFGDERTKKEAMDAIEHAKGFIRYETVQQINLRVAPELHFKLDNTLDEAERMDALIKKTIAEDEARAKAREAREETDKDGEDT